MCIKMYRYAVLLTLMALPVHGRHRVKFWSGHPIEQEHDPYWLITPYYINGTQYIYNVNGTKITAESWETPNWLLEEPPFAPYHAAKYYNYAEENRPYRITPPAYVLNNWQYQTKDTPKYNLGCYCTTVYKKLTPLAGCAVLTLRHILTTATSTELILKNYRHHKTLKDIIGFWYHTWAYFGNNYNDTYYQGVSRIHYHPWYTRPEKVNLSHPLPYTFDLAVWANEYPLGGGALLCDRATSGWSNYRGNSLGWPFLYIVVGYQYIKAHKKKPLPWFQYGVRTRAYLPCPKVEWGPFLCIGLSVSTYWSKYGVESGAALHRTNQHRSESTNGLAGMASFSMSLRSEGLVHYFTELNIHPVIDFLYNAYVGKMRYEYLDYRFQDTKGKAPVPQTWHYVDFSAWKWQAKAYPGPGYGYKITPIY